MSVRDLRVGCDRFATLTDRQAVGEPLHIEDEIFLTRHARRCEACRAEMAIYSALPEILNAPRQASLAAVTTHPPLVHRSRFRSWLLVAAAISVGGAAAAELVLIRPTSLSPAARGPTANATIDPPSVPAPRKLSRAVPLPTLEEVMPEPEPPASPPPTVSDPLPARANTFEPRAVPFIPTAKLAPPPAPSESESPSPNDILREARALRARGRSLEAVSAYGRLIREYPRSAEARTARVSVGDLQLGPLADPSAALASFDAYLSGGPGALALEARYGRIRALGALGRASEEQREISRFVQDFPGTVQAKNLMARMSPTHP